MADTVPIPTDLTGSSPAAPATIPPPAKRSRSAAAFRALRHRNFQLFFGGQLISLIGTWMQTVAEAWLVYRLTHSPWLLGMLGFVGQIPIFLLSPLGGLVADRFRRQYVVIGTQTASMILPSILATLTLTGHVRVWHVMLLGTLLGVVNAFDVPARQSFFIEMVGRDDLLNAIALNSSMFNGARIAGPAIAGILIATVGEGWCFAINAMSYLAVIAGLLMMRIENPTQIQGTGSAIEHVKEGFRFTRHTAPIRALLVLVATVGFVALPFTILMPVFASTILHRGASAYGWLMGMIGAGALLGALLLATREELRGLGALVGYAAAAFSITLILFGASRWYWLSLAILVPCGFAMMTQFAATNTLIQAMVPDRLRGRVMSVYSMMFLGTSPLGSLVAGKLAALIGAPLTVVAAGAVSLIGSILFIRKWPAMRASARELVAAQEMTRMLSAEGASGAGHERSGDAVPQ